MPRYSTQLLCSIATVICRSRVRASSAYFVNSVLSVRVPYLYRGIVSSITLSTLSSVSEYPISAVVSSRRLLWQLCPQCQSALYLQWHRLVDYSVNSVLSVRVPYLYSGIVSSITLATLSSVSEYPISTVVSSRRLLWQLCPQCQSTLSLQWYRLVDYSGNSVLSVRVPYLW